MNLGSYLSKNVITKVAWSSIRSALNHFCDNLLKKWRNIFQTGTTTGYTIVINYNVKIETSEVSDRKSKKEGIKATLVY